MQYLLSLMPKQTDTKPVKHMANPSKFRRIIGESEAVQCICDDIESIADSKHNVLINGETCRTARRMSGQQVVKSVEDLPFSSGSGSPLAAQHGELERGHSRVNLSRQTGVPVGGEQCRGAAIVEDVGQLVSLGGVVDDDERPGRLEDAKDGEHCLDRSGTRGIRRGR